MNIKTHNDIQGEAIKQLRLDSGKNQREFWGAFGVTQSGGSRFEKSGKVTPQVQRLLFLNCVAGINYDSATEQGASQLIALGKVKASESPQKVQIGERLQEAHGFVKKAIKSLSKVEE